MLVEGEGQRVYVGDFFGSTAHGRFRDRELESGTDTCYHVLEVFEE